MRTSAVFSWATSVYGQGRDQGLWSHPICPSIHVPILFFLPDRTSISWPWKGFTQPYPSTAAPWRRLLFYYLLYFPGLFSIPLLFLSPFFFFLQRALYISRNGRWDMFQRNIIQGLPFFSLQEIQHTLNFSCLIPLALPLKISLGDTLCVKSPLHLRFDFHSNKTIPEITLSPQISHWIFGKIII